jgi:hypothetical protein
LDAQDVLGVGLVDAAVEGRLDAPVRPGGRSEPAEDGRIEAEGLGREGFVEEEGEGFFLLPARDRDERRLRSGIADVVAALVLAANGAQSRAEETFEAGEEGAEGGGEGAGVAAVAPGERGQALDEGAVEGGALPCPGHRISGPVVARQPGVEGSGRVQMLFHAVAVAGLGAEAGDLPGRLRVRGVDVGDRPEVVGPDRGGEEVPEILPERRQAGRGIVHHRGGDAVFEGRRRAAEVVVEPQGVPHLVHHHPANPLSDQLVGCRRAREGRSCPARLGAGEELPEGPVLEDDAGVEQDVGVQDLAGARIDDRLAGAAELRLVAGDPPYGVHSQVGGIGAFREVFGAEGFGEAGGGEGAVPGFDPLLDPRPPALGHGALDAVDDGLARREAPAVGVAHERGVLGA